MPGEAQQAAAVDRALSMKSRTFSEESDANRLGSETDSVLDNDTQVQIIRLRGQIERTRILINEQLRLRNMQPLEPGQTTLPAPSKRTSIISAITSAVGSAISTVTGVTSTPGTVNGSAPSSLSKEQEIKQLQEELNRTRKEITGIPQTPTLFTLPSARSKSFLGGQGYRIPHKKTRTVIMRLYHREKVIRVGLDCFAQEHQVSERR
ncbi:hypothetical protein BCR33DRAFT_127729 [Rhizoclosmatium globosum]|uniref:Uncharacterized protein n=1 Tax=Rhizoclosmatium globosum TaxID=329046 RepID=A0A1Y2CH70_9FUNG|nr:hypothetical protein BCR33DRAFT_127729 [Rhizoclosmatium globosum]|eukprot:ORY46388.1 hypothetical protein BCR33DRAFT_127729 [Rhizoclosmatium globosum]